MDRTPDNYTNQTPGSRDDQPAAIDELQELAREMLGKLSPEQKRKIAREVADQIVRRNSQRRAEANVPMPLPPDEKQDWWELAGEVIIYALADLLIAYVNAWAVRRIVKKYFGYELGFRQALAVVTIGRLATERIRRPGSKVS